MPAAENEPVPVNVDELMPNSPKFVVAVPALLDTLKFVLAAVPEDLFCKTICA